MYRIKDIMENFNSKEFRTEIHSLYLPGRHTVLPLLVLLGKETLFESLFARDLHSFGDWFLGGLSLHLNHLIGSRVTNYDWPFGTLSHGLFGSNLDTRDLETYPSTYCGHF